MMAEYIGAGVRAQQKSDEPIHFLVLQL